MLQIEVNVLINTASLQITFTFFFVRSKKQHFECDICLFQRFFLSCKFTGHKSIFNHETQVMILINDEVLRAALADQCNFHEAPLGDARKLQCVFRNRDMNIQGKKRATLQGITQLILLMDFCCNIIKFLATDKKRHTF